jgi:hypothetical protein
MVGLLRQLPRVWLSWLSASQWPALAAPMILHRALLSSPQRMQPISLDRLCILMVVSPCSLAQRLRRFNHLKSYSAPAGYLLVRCFLFCWKVNKRVIVHKCHATRRSICHESLTIYREFGFKWMIFSHSNPK